MSSQLRSIRLCFTVPRGYGLIEADYKSAEIFTLGYMANCPKLVRDAEGDLHARGAVTSMGVPPWEGFETGSLPTKEWLKTYKSERIARKTINFGIPYQRGAKAISREIADATKGAIRCSIDEAQAMIEGYYRDYPEVRDYVEHCKASVLDPGYITSAYNRRRRFYMKPTMDKSLIAAAGREAVNMPIQGTVADTLNVALCNFRQYKLDNPGVDFKVLLPVHDAVLIEAADKDIIKVVDEVVPLCMKYGAVVPSWSHGGRRPTKPFVLDIDVGVVLRWGAEGTTKDEMRAHGLSDEVIERFAEAA